MTERLPPAETSTDQRLDVANAHLERIANLLTPPVASDPEDGDTIELKEPEATPKRAKR